MTAPALIAELSSAGTDALWRTNPVLCLDRLLHRWNSSDGLWARASERFQTLLLCLTTAHGIRVPPEAVRRWAGAGALPIGFALPDADANPRVVGVVIDGAAEAGYVVPLRAEPAEGRWSLDPQLPFTASQLRDILSGLLRATDLPDLAAVPERLSFAIENPTGLTARGESMTVAAALAVLDTLGGRVAPLLRAAVALVELLPGGRLGAVADAPRKLETARRECGTLSLVVCCPGTAAIYPAEVVWEVESLAELSRRLQTAGLLAPLLVGGPLTHPQAKQVLDRLREFVSTSHRYREAADLGDRVRRIGLADPPDPDTATEMASLVAAAYRHHGRFVSAVAVGREVYERVAGLAGLSSDDQEADAATEYAACLFSSHRFAEIAPLLEPWAEEADRHPRRFRPRTRVKVWNTLGRGLAVLGLPGWEGLFARSLDLQHSLREWDNHDRTLHYIAHARQRGGHLQGAQEVLAEHSRRGSAAGSDPWVAFLHANQARLVSTTWEDAALDRQAEGDRPPYPSWLYLQATGRQPMRSPIDAEIRLNRAIRLLRAEADGLPANVCSLLAELLALRVAADSNNVDLWRVACAAIQAFLRHSPDHSTYYGPLVN